MNLIARIEERLAAALARRWWLLVLRGVAAIAFGIFAWAWPGISLASLVLVFGAYSLADGVLALGTAMAGPADHEARWIVVLEGLVGIGVGILTFVAPAITALALVFYIAIWAVSTGIIEIILAIRLRKEIEGEWLLGLAGLASVAFGVMMMWQPGAGALTLLWLIAGYAVLFGVLLLTLAFRVRRFLKH
ncbi:MAG: HdeD family acid-resistance protein [Proteobacteria bacterium]|nr:HdeD family acid-resistance protein [Pseudomonadota bacterium]